MTKNPLVLFSVMDRPDFGETIIKHKGFET